MNNSPVHITIICSRLDLPGGIERAVVNTANLFIKKNHKVTLVILDNSSNSFYPIDPSIKIVQQPLSFGITPEGNMITRKIKLLTDLFQLRKLIRQLQSDIIICTEYPFAIAAILCGARKQSKVISWEHHHFYELRRNSFWNKLFYLTYPRLDAIVCLNEDEKKNFKPINSQVFIIPNFINKSGVQSNLSNKKIVTVARLTSVKGTDLLLQTVKLVLKQHPDWQWKLIGDGDMKQAVLQFIEKENLQNKFIIQKPFDHDILSEYQNASMYLMTSRNECFPMTLLEAMSAGLPCIAFDCETGPRHIITNNENGLLIEKENPVKLAEAISFLIINEEKRKKMGEKAIENVQRFSPEKIYELWKQLF